MTTVFVHGLPETHRIWDSLRANLDRDSIAVARLVSHGVPIDQARAIGAAHDETMSQSILDFYRSAVPNVSAGWWDDITGPAPSRGLVSLGSNAPGESGRRGTRPGRSGESVAPN